MAAITFLTGSHLTYPIRHFSEGVLILMKEIGSNFDFDLTTRQKYQDEICMVLENCFFKELQPFSLRTKSFLNEGKEEVVPFVIFFIFVAYVIGDNKSDEFPKFFDKILDDKMKKELETVRQFSRECGGELFVLPKLRILKRNHEKCYEIARLGPSSSLEDIVASFIALPNRLFHSPVLLSWWQMQPRKGGDVTSIIETDLTSLVLSHNTTGRITLGVTTELGLDPIQQYQTYKAIDDLIFQNSLKFHQGANSSFKGEEEEAVSFIVFWFITLYIEGIKNNQLPLRVFDKFSDEASRKKVEGLRSFFRTADRNTPSLEELLLEHREFYGKVGLTPSSSIEEILTAFINQQYDNYIPK